MVKMVSLVLLLHLCNFNNIDIKYLKCFFRTDLTFECYSLQEAEQWTSIIANHVVYAIQTKQSAANDGATFDAGDLIGEVPREKKG